VATAKYDRTGVKKIMEINEIFDIITELKELAASTRV